MSDMLKTIVPKSNQLNADDLIGGRTITIRISKVSIAAGDQPVALNYEGDNGKPYMPGKSMRRVLVHVWGSDANKYVGRSMTLFRDDTVKFGGVDVGGIRISHMSHLDSPMTVALTASKAKRAPFTVKPMNVGAPSSQPLDNETIALRGTGTAAALKGSKEYIAWKDSLTQEQKEKIKSFHSGWAKDAKAADIPEHDYEQFGDPEHIQQGAG